MSEKMTLESLKAAKMRGVMFLDGEDFYENTYECLEYPHLTKVSRGPIAQVFGNPMKRALPNHTTTFYVDGKEIPRPPQGGWDAWAQAIVDAYNAGPGESQ